MREIKFRAWNKPSAKMYKWNTVKKEALVTHHDNSFIFMQFTGLKDKNGKEIYEGDIILWGTIKRNKDVVIWDDTYHGFILQNIMKIDKILLNSNLEVIGNIYENPELLGDGEK